MATPAQIATAGGHMSKFWKLVDMTDTEFSNDPDRKKRIWDVLCVPKEAVAQRPNAQTTIAGLRGIFGSYDFLNRESIHVTKYLLDATVTCTFCFQAGAVRGVFDTNPATIKAHQTTAAHTGAVSARAARQQDLGQAGLVVQSVADRQLNARTLIVGHFVANGMPYSSLPRFLSPSCLVMVCRRGNPRIV